MKRAFIASGDLHNVGDFALLTQCVQGLRSIVGIDDVTVRQWNPVDVIIARQLDELGVRVGYGKDLSTLMAAARSLVVVGGGQMVRDNTSLGSLVSLKAAMALANATGGATAAIGCGVDIMRNPRNRALWRSIMQNAALVTVRDQASLDAASAFATAARPSLTADLAFLPGALHDRLASNGTNRKALIIAVCRDDSEKRTVDVRQVAELATAYSVELGATEICLVSHDARPTMDPVVSAEIAREISFISPSTLIRRVESYNIDDYIAAYTRASAVITNRLHAIIFGMLAGRPVLALDDGTAKILAAATKFALPMQPLAEGYESGARTAFLGEAKSGVPQERTDAIAGAKRSSAENFHLLRAAIRL